MRFTHAGEQQTLECEYIAGCDGFWGVSRGALPADAVRVYDREYPFAWLGILASMKPASEELIYSYHDDLGFALHSMRSPVISRLYLQCRPDEPLAEWPDERIWHELEMRFATAEGFELSGGPILEKGVTAMRSFVVEPMQHGRLFLAGDAAHIVPPTGAKGMNLAIADVKVLAEALEAKYASGSDDVVEELFGDVLATRLARRALFLVDDVDAPPLSRTTSTASSTRFRFPNCAIRSARRRPRRRWLKTTWVSSRCELRLRHARRQKRQRRGRAQRRGDEHQEHVAQRMGQVDLDRGDLLGADLQATRLRHQQVGVDAGRGGGVDARGKHGTSDRHPDAAANRPGKHAHARHHAAQVPADRVLGRDRRQRQEQSQAQPDLEIDQRRAATGHCRLERSGTRRNQLPPAAHPARPVAASRCASRCGPSTRRRWSSPRR